MNNISLTEIIAQLEQAIQGEQTIAKFRGFGEVALYANKAGYLKIAIEMLKSAIHEKGDLHDLFQQDSDFSIDYMVNSEADLDFYCK